MSASPVLTRIADNILAVSRADSPSCDPAVEELDLTAGPARPSSPEVLSELIDLTQPCAPELPGSAARATTVAYQRFEAAAPSSRWMMMRLIVFMSLLNAPKHTHDKLERNST